MARRLERRRRAPRGRVLRLPVRRARGRARAARHTARRSRRTQRPRMRPGEGSPACGRGARAGDDRGWLTSTRVQELPEPARGRVRVDPGGRSARGCGPRARSTSARASRARSPTRIERCSRSRRSARSRSSTRSLRRGAAPRARRSGARADLGGRVGVALSRGVARGDREDDDGRALGDGAALVPRTARSRGRRRADAHAIRQPLRWRAAIGELVADRAAPFTQHDHSCSPRSRTGRGGARARPRGDAGVLAQEIHHRVKNNLQTVASLLRLQARADGPVDARKALEDSVSRILAIAAVHEVLTERRDDDVDLADLFERLRAMLVQGVGAGREVDASLEAVSRAGHRATALALVFSELLQNALEHGGARPVESAPERRGRARDRRRRPDHRREPSADGPVDRPGAGTRRAARHARPDLRRRHARRGAVPRPACVTVPEGLPPRGFTGASHPQLAAFFTSAPILPPRRRSTSRVRMRSATWRLRRGSPRR